MRILFALPGLHQYDRGAEIAFISIATELAKVGETVTLMGSGQKRAETSYQFLRVKSMRREFFESFPSTPVLPNEYAYEELTWVPNLFCRYRPADYDVTITCSYPFTNWVLRRPVLRGFRPPHVFVTQNGDWPARSNNSIYRFFGCEGLICTNPEFYEWNKHRWRCELIPNGVDCRRFTPGPSQRHEFGLPADRLIVLMVSALIPSKRVNVGIEAVSHLSDAHLVVAGDGPLRHQIDSAAAELLPGRFSRLSVPPEKMCNLYRSADVFLHLSTDESSSLALVEAMASGLPVVAHDSPRERYVVGDDEYLVKAAHPPKAIARQIELARNSSKSYLEKRLMKAAAFSWANIAGKYQKALREIIARY